MFHDPSYKGGTWSMSSTNSAQGRVVSEEATKQLDWLTIIRVVSQNERVCNEQEEADAAQIQHGTPARIDSDWRQPETKAAEASSFGAAQGGHEMQAC